MPAENWSSPGCPNNQTVHPVSAVKQATVAGTLNDAHRGAASTEADVNGRLRR